MPFRLGRLLNTACALMSVIGCGSQFSDPILAASEPSGGAASSAGSGSNSGSGGGDASAACPRVWVAHFDGATFASTARPIEDDFTIEAWISTTSSPPSNQFSEGSVLVFADVEKIAANDFALALSNAKPLFNVGQPDKVVAGTSDVTTGDWVHVAVSRSKDSGVLLVFVNGVLEGAGVGSTQSLSDQPVLSIGGRAGRNFFTGSMSELRLWNQVRSQAAIVGDMRHRLTGQETGLVRLYHLDEQQGAIARDTSMAGQDAEFIGSPTWEQSSSPFCVP